MATGGGPEDRTHPNVLVVGTPGTGKSTLCERLVEVSGGTMKHVSISDVAKEKELFDGFDNERDVPIIDEDRYVLMARLRTVLEQAASLSAHTLL